MKRSRESAQGYSGPTANDEGDCLDKLLDQYDAQAALDLQQARQAGRPPPPQQQAAQRRDAALQRPLDADNKGFKLLAAMGYQPGQGLGGSVKGRSEPIPLDLKQNRLGLGAISKKAAAREALKQREAEAEEQMRRAVQEGEARIQAGRQRTAELFAARREQGQLRKAQHVCETLDEAAGITSNYLWLPPPEEDALESPAGPGRGADAGHAEKPACYGAQQAGRAGVASRGALRVDDELLEEGEAFRRDITGPGQEGGERLQDVLQYMRDRHRYCLYCCSRYEDDADMQTHCPGMLEDDHE